MTDVIALYAGVLGLMAIAIAAQAGILRGRLKISVGDGGNPDLLLAMRRHANFVENVPLTLLLIALLEMKGVSANAIHAMGASLVVFRASHALGLKANATANFGRVLGAAGNALLLLVTSIWLLIQFF